MLLGWEKTVLTPISFPRKDSQNVTKRTLLNRTKQTKEVLGMISGGTAEASTVQMAHVVKSLDEQTHGEILKSFKSTVTFTPENVAAMKATLNLPWNRLRDNRRWLQTFNVTLASEGKCCDIVKGWLGDALRAEEIPAMVIKNKKITYELRAWCYIFKLVGYVLRYLNDLQSNNMLYDHPFIPSNEIHLKIGGDHGGGSFKMEFQVGNIEKTNKPENTVIFSIAEAKDYKVNIALCVERFKAQIEYFKKVKWQDKEFHVFLFGDYQLLCNLYGLSGASARHPCLWCHIPSGAMVLPKADCEGLHTLRTLETLSEHFHSFQTCYEGNLKNAKHAFNVISRIFFNIPLEQVCIPGLHITLGVYVKLLQHFEYFCKDLDCQIAHLLAQSDEEAIGDEFNAFVDILKEIREVEEKKSDERHEIIIAELNQTIFMKNSTHNY